MFLDESGRFGSVVLITDGETHDENALAAAKELAQKGIMVNTVGIGSVEGSTITDSAGHQKKDANGQVVLSKLNEPLLQQIAQTANGTYVHLDNSDAAVSEILQQYAHIEKKALGDTTLLSYHTFYIWLALPMVLFLLAELFIPDRKKTRA